MIRIAIHSDSKFPVDKKKLRSRISAVFVSHGITSQAELAVFVVGSRKMAQLHSTHMGTEGVTDVLSFPLSDPQDTTPFVSSPDGILRLGDIVVCYPVALSRALKRQVLVDEVVGELAEHGCLHLLGIHHD